MTAARSRRARVRGAAAPLPRPPRRPAILIGVSSCLMGEDVRYDGGHKRNAFVVEVLARRFTLVPVCPEVEMGLGTPREPIRLGRSGRAVRLVAPGSGADHTEAMRRYAEARVSELERLDLSGYVLKKDSPSCGAERVKVWRGEEAAPTGRGAFAAVLTARLPLLPVVEETALGEREGREEFLARVLAYHRLRARERTGRARGTPRARSGRRRPARKPRL